MVSALAMHVVRIEMALVRPATVPCELSAATLAAVVELPLKKRAIRELLDTMALLHVHAPLPFVGRAIGVGVSTVTVLPVRVELPFILGPVRENKLALAMLLRSTPLAVVKRPAR